ncbi:flagellar hook-length control protein FliK [Heyndrickxia faecalis]|uniref:flagellar hook-length control protein FliK n=1 Tax=Heyndrickxia faecalis TaxID=2824910 RepID=UPI001B39F554|nr:flagellar hook-length control protein FliK [Heyndrickxia faecalis]MBQ4910960.1 flagellar hook-length control protein FliK [Heyndrickxia faecalis]
MNVNSALQAVPFSPPSTQTAGAQLQTQPSGFFQQLSLAGQDSGRMTENQEAVDVCQKLQQMIVAVLTEKAGAAEQAREDGSRDEEADMQAVSALFNRIMRFAGAEDENSKKKIQETKTAIETGDAAAAIMNMAQMLASMPVPSLIKLGLEDAETLLRQVGAVLKTFPENTAAGINMMQTTEQLAQLSEKIGRFLKAISADALNAGQTVSSAPQQPGIAVKEEILKTAYLHLSGGKADPSLFKKAPVLPLSPAAAALGMASNPDHANSAQNGRESNQVLLQNGPVSANGAIPEMNEAVLPANERSEPAAAGTGTTGTALLQTDNNEVTEALSKDGRSSRQEGVPFSLAAESVAADENAGNPAAKPLQAGTSGADAQNGKAAIRGNAPSESRTGGPLQNQAPSVQTTAHPEANTGQPADGSQLKALKATADEVQATASQHIELMEDGIPGSNGRVKTQATAGENGRIAVPGQNAGPQQENGKLEDSSRHAALDFSREIQQTGQSGNDSTEDGWANGWETGKRSPVAHNSSHLQAAEEINGNGNTAPAFSLSGKVEQLVLYTGEKHNPVSYRQFVQEFANIIQKAAYSSHKGANRLLIRLEPENLGSLRVELLEQDGKLAAKILTDTGAAKDLLDSQLQQLKHALAGQQVQLTKMDIEYRDTAAQTAHGQPGDSGGREQRQQQQKRRENPEPGHFSAMLENNMIDAEA